MRDKTTCAFHGGKSKAGPAHPNYRHGRRSKSAARIAALLNQDLHRPVQLSVNVFPMPWQAASDAIARGARLHALAFRPEDVSDRQWLRALYAARRELERQIRGLREYLAAGETSLDGET